MEIITSLYKVTKTYKPCVLALGTFDGLHKGHLDIINTAKDYAAVHHLQLGVFTFSNHPYAYFRPKAVPVSLIASEEKIAMLEELGVDYLIDIPFDEHLANEDPLSFLQDLQVFSYRCLVVGENFTYGYMGTGNTDALLHTGQRQGFDVVVRSLMQQDGNVISSTSIRNLIQHGNLLRARSMLGRPYAVAGIVVPGFKRGRALNFPTANLHLDRQQVALPPPGVYAVRIKCGENSYEGMANLGQNPTFTDVAKELLEVHLFNFQGDLYGKRLVVSLLKFIRGEVKFASIPALQAQMQLDQQHIKAYFEALA